MAEPQPAHDEFELTLLGPGLGESVVLHLGAGRWAVVDSCRGSSRRPAALDYLAHIGVGPESVQLLVATHWHDDHVRGFGEMVEACPDATLAISMALESDEFLTLVAADAVADLGSKSGVKELKRVMEARGSRGYSFAIADRRLYAPDEDVEVYSLSPSDESVRVAQRAFADLAPRLGERPDGVPRPKRNPSTVVLHVRVGGVVALLGGDLEEPGGGDVGWSGVVASNARPLSKGHIVKVPHHGSDDAHADAMWDELLQPNPHAALTPMRQGRVDLPRDSDVARIVGLTDSAWSTRRKATAKPARRPSAVERTIRSTVRWIAAHPTTPSRVTFRCSISNPDDWSIDAEDTAERLA